MTEVLMIAGAIVIAGFLIDLSIIWGRQVLARRRQNRERGSSGNSG